MRKQKGIFESGYPKVDFIIKSPHIRNRLDALLFLNYDGCNSLFNLTEEELSTYKDIVHSEFDKIVAFGHLTIEAYLLSTEELDTLELYKKGVDYILAVSKHPDAALTQKCREKLYSNIVDNLLIIGNSEKDVRNIIRIKESLARNVDENKNINTIDVISDLYEEEEF